MLATERRQFLVEEVNRLGKVVTSEAAARLGVSDVTVRADLDELERRGRVARTHGGAIAATPDSNAAIIGFDTRMSMNRDAKRRIALAAAAHIEGSQTVILDAGTTVHHLAHALPEISRLTVFTPALAVAQQLLGVDGVETHLMGGRVDRNWLETVGTPHEQGIVDLIAHTLFLGAHGVDNALDIVDLSRDLALNKLQFAQRARKIILMMDSSKWGSNGSVKVMPIERVHVVVTDSGIPLAVRRQLERLDLELIVV